MSPLHVRALVPQQIVLRGNGTLALDALLMAAVCKRDRIPPITVARAEGYAPAPEIPIARSEHDPRIHLATHARPKLVEHELRFKNRRFPVREALRLSAMSRVDQSAGPQKSYRIPYSAGFVDCGAIDWWCVGDADGVRDLLSWITGLGSHVAVGYGRVDEWTIESCESWDGFPLVRDGVPQRALPLDWPGVTESVVGFAVLEPPYWERAREEPAMVAV